jgi:hypothetical protein
MSSVLIFDLFPEQVTESIGDRIIGTKPAFAALCMMAVAGVTLRQVSFIDVAAT